MNLEDPLSEIYTLREILYVLRDIRDLLRSSTQPVEVPATPQNSKEIPRRPHISTISQAAALLEQKSITREPLTADEVRANVKA